MSNAQTKTTTQPLTGKDALLLRQGRSMNQAQFWGPLGVTQSGGSRYETGRKLPRTVELLVRMTYLPDGITTLRDLRKQAGEK